MKNKLVRKHCENVETDVDTTTLKWKDGGGGGGCFVMVAI